MKITREVNGQQMEFELTKYEIIKAYNEQNKENHIDDIKDAVRWFFDDFDCDGKTVMELIDSDAEFLEDVINMYVKARTCENWESYAQGAITDALERYGYM